MTRLLALLAFASVAAFLAVLAFKVPSPDLIILTALTVCFVAWDFLTSTRKD